MLGHDPNAPPAGGGALVGSVARRASAPPKRLTASAMGTGFDESRRAEGGGVPWTKAQLIALDQGLYAFG